MCPLGERDRGGYHSLARKKSCVARWTLIYNLDVALSRYLVKRDLYCTYYASLV